MRAASIRVSLLTLQHLLSTPTFTQEQEALFLSVTDSLAALIHETGLLSLESSGPTDVQTLRLITKFAKKIAKTPQASPSVCRAGVRLQLAVSLSMGDVGGVVRVAKTIRSAPYPVLTGGADADIVAKPPDGGRQDESDEEDEAEAPERKSEALTLSSFIALLDTRTVKYHLSTPHSLITCFDVMLPGGGGGGGSDSSGGAAQDEEGAALAVAGDGGRDCHIVTGDAITVVETGYHGGLKGVTEKVRR